MSKQNTGSKSALDKNQYKHITYLLQDDKHLPILEAYLETHEPNMDTGYAVMHYLKINKSEPSAIRDYCMKYFNDKYREHTIRTNLKSALDAKEKELDAKEKELDTKEKELDTKEKELDTKEKELDTKETIPICLPCIEHQKKYTSQEGAYNKFLQDLDLDTTPEDSIKDLLESTKFLIYMNTIRQLQSVILNKKVVFQHPTSVIHMFRVLTEVDCNAEDFIELATVNKLTDYQILATYYIDHVDYYSNYPEAMYKVKELFKQKNIDTFERDYDVAYANHILKKYAK